MSIFQELSTQKPSKEKTFFFFVVAEIIGCNVMKQKTGNSAIQNFQFTVGYITFGVLKYDTSKIPLWQLYVNFNLKNVGLV